MHVYGSEERFAIMRPIEVVSMVILRIFHNYQEKKTKLRVRDSKNDDYSYRNHEVLNYSRKLTIRASFQSTKFHRQALTVTTVISFV